MSLRVGDVIKVKSSNRCGAPIRKACLSEIQYEAKKLQQLQLIKPLSCAQCYYKSAIGAKFCNACGCAFPAPVQYCGFWIRALAYTLDCVVLLAVNLVLYAFWWLWRTAQPENHLPTVLFVAMCPLIGFYYFCAFESSNWQATPGKRAFGLAVTKIDGERLSFWQSVWRNTAKYLLSSFLYIGFLMVAFGPKKQGLHDLVSNTRVVKRSLPESNRSGVSGIGGTKHNAKLWPRISNKRHIIMWTGLVLIAGMGLCPPWKESLNVRSVKAETPMTYYPIFSPPPKPHNAPAYGVCIDTERLLIQWFIVALMTGGLMLTLGSSSAPRSSRTVAGDST